MRVAIAGAHGKIASALTPILVRREDSVIGLIRNPGQEADVVALGADAVICDLERAAPEEIASAIAGADAAVFAAGAGPGSGAERKLTMDRDGAIKLLEAATTAGVPRFLIISAVGAESPPDGDDVYDVYLRAKAEADDAVKASNRDWTIIRPGRLTDDPATGRVKIDSTPFRGSVPRADVAAVIARVLPDPGAVGRLLYVNGGEEPIEQALVEIIGPV